MRYDNLALDKIWQVKTGHPYFLQYPSGKQRRRSCLRRGLSLEAGPAGPMGQEVSVDKPGDRRGA